MLEPGEILSHYKIVSAIGAGGMGEVYMAEDTKLGRQVALKVLLSSVSEDKDRVGRFIQEAKAASALNHPNILTVFEIGTVEGVRYISTELIKGDTLRERIRKEALNLGDALDIILQITAALGAAHEAGIIHRDIKPENIMIRSDGLVKVLDFGLAKLAPDVGAGVETTLPQLNTKPGMLVGTVAYMSPEQARGRKIDTRSDIFSLGIVLFEIFAGKRPFQGEGHLDLISSILKDDPPSLRQVAPDMPRQLERIVDKTLRKDRENRYQSVRDLHLDVEDLREEMKFEAKLHKSVHPTVSAAIHDTNQSNQITVQSNLRSVFTTGISKTRRFTLLHALIFLVITAGVVGAVWYLRPATGSNTLAGTYKTVEVASWNSAPGELSASASFSPDGKLIALASTKSGTKGIWVTQTTSTEAIQITNDSFSNTDPLWSPKGDEIAYVSRRPNADGSSTTAIWRVSALGGTPRTVATFNDSDSLRRWTQSGKIYYQSKGELHAIDIASGATQQVTALGENKAIWANISPDEKMIAYAVKGNDGWKIFTSDLAMTASTEVATGRGTIDNYIAWVPEKKRFLFGSTIDGVPQIFVTTAGSGRNDLIATPETDSNVVDAAPDGRSIILSSGKEESNIWRVNLVDGIETPVARDLNAKLWPAVSPDGERIVFQSIKNLSAGNKIHDGNIAVKAAKQTSDNDRPTILAEHGYLPAWSPDGSAIAFFKKTDKLSELYLVSSNGGGERRLAGGGIPGIAYSASPYNHMHTRAFSWSPDGSSIAYLSEKDRIANLWTVSVRDGTERQVTSNADDGLQFHSPIWSSDGGRLAFGFQRRSRDENGKTGRALLIVDVVSGSTTEVLKTDRLIRLIGWSPDESGLIFVEASKDFSGLPPETSFNIVSVAGQAETTIARLQNVYFYNIFLSYDRKNIAYAARDQNMDNLWVVPTTGGVPRKRTNNNDTGQYFSRLAWLPDGSAIVFGKQTRFSLLSIISDIN